MKSILLCCFLVFFALGCKMNEADRDPTAEYVGEWRSEYIEDEFMLTVMRLTIEKSGDRRLRIAMSIYTEAKGNFDIPDDQFIILEDIFVPKDGTPSFDYEWTDHGRTLSVHGSMIVSKSKMSVAMTGVDLKTLKSESTSFVLYTR